MKKLQKLTLMKAQHIIAKIAGAKNWDSLNKFSEQNSSVISFEKFIALEFLEIIHRINHQF